MTASVWHLNVAERWKDRGEILVLYREGGQKAGIATSSATHWAFDLYDGDQPYLSIVFPVDRLKEVCAAAFKAGRRRTIDDCDFVVLRITDLFKVEQK